MHLGKAHHLEGHDFSLEIRSKLLDWMIKVFEVMGLESKTFFVTVNIMDLYILFASEQKQIINKDELYLIALATIYIACKIEETYRVPLRIILKELGK